jgi:PhnB protein
MNAMKEAEAACGFVSLVPWLSVRDAEDALRFYQAAFDAREVYRYESPEGGLVVRLSLNGIEFWVSGDSVDKVFASPENLGGGSIRLILTVEDPDRCFARAVDAGAKIIFPVDVGHGWRLGRLEDPFGLHWEIGKPLEY